MMNRIHADESVQVLVFVVSPLLCLFIVGVIWWIRSRQRTTGWFPTFSVSICTVGHQEAYIVYKDQDWKVTCDRRKACLLAPGELSEEDIRMLA